MTGTNTATVSTTTSKTTTNQKGVKNMSIKTTKRNYLFVVQKKVAGQWQMITDAIFTRRSTARAASNELNNLIPRVGRGPNRRYRVTMMRPLSVSIPQ